VANLLAGIFVGGKSSRMGRPKGLLRPPTGEGSIVERWMSLLGDEGVPWVLVGRQVGYERWEAIDDDPPGIGPIGGLHALSRRAGDGAVLALGCDMPYVTAPLLRKLILAPAAPAVAPRKTGTWEPLFARYDTSTMIAVLPQRIARHQHSLQSLLSAVAAAELSLTDAERAELGDWDTLLDMEAK
jgi:molybdopterin-guanine dinucleotide biosynthesis protein A